MLISPNLFNEFLISVPSFYALVLLRLDSVHKYMVLFFCCCLYQKKNLQLLFITCIVSLEMMRKSVTWDVSQGMASMIACKKINSSENCVLGWISLQSCSYFLRKRELVSTLTLTLTLKQNSLRKKIDPDPDPEFYWHPAEMEKGLK